MVRIKMLQRSSNPHTYEQMLHVWDHFDFTQDVAWFKEQGYPLLKVFSFSDAADKAHAYGMT